MYDRFRARVIFPIHNATGRVLGFGGRTLSKEDNIPKYVNSPESEIYNKSQILYGLYFAKNAIIRNDNCLLVEGYTDVISLHQAGIENVVASSGTSLTDEQVRLIKRYTQNITILYDGDPAGIKASFRGIDMVLEQGMNVRIVLFPDNEDPDSYARKHRRQELEELITSEAQDFIRFKTSLLLKEAAGDPDQAGRADQGDRRQHRPDPRPDLPFGLYQGMQQPDGGPGAGADERAEQDPSAEVTEKGPGSRKRHSRRWNMRNTRRRSRSETEVASSEFQEHDLIRLMIMYGQNDLLSGGRTKRAQDGAPDHGGQYITEEIHRDDMHFRNPIYQKIFDEYCQACRRARHPMSRSLSTIPTTCLEHGDRLAEQSL